MQLGKDLNFKAKTKGNTISITSSNDSLKKLIIRLLLTYLITPLPLMCQVNLPSNNHDNQNKKQSTLENSTSQLNESLKYHDAFFSN